MYDIVVFGNRECGNNVFQQISKLGYFAKKFPVSLKLQY